MHALIFRGFSRWVRALRGASIAVAVTSCSTAASVFFDTPEKPPQQVAQPARTVSAGDGAARDTLRPPIEKTLDPIQVLALLPRDGGGHVDWVAALRDGVIDPRRRPPGTEAPPVMDGFRFDFKLKGPAPMFDAEFPHSIHVEWLDCRTCHNRIFEYRAEPITMEAVNKGEACGECHGTVAFPATACYKCHTAMPPSGQHSPNLVKDITLTRGTDSTGVQEGAGAYPPARFAHWVHRIRFRCMACHPNLFEARAGANAVTMADLTAGRACGACHSGGVAFDVLQCSRCHVSGDQNEIP